MTQVEHLPENLTEGSKQNAAYGTPGSSAHNSAQQTRIVVAMHKPYWMPNDSLYLPVFAGAAGNSSIESVTDAGTSPDELGAKASPSIEKQPGATGVLTVHEVQRDDEGDNISACNPRYSELTALYWAWKNLGNEVEYLGLAHYRRHFKGTGERGVLTLAEAEELFLQAPVILPKKRRYYIETVGSHYAHTCDPRELDAMREVLASRAPDYSEAYEQVLSRWSGHMFNMFVARRDIADAYCAWLFPLLEAVDTRLGTNFPNPYAARAVGRLSEQLLDIWLEHEGIPYVERDVVEFDVNWSAKIRGFLAAKFLGRRYG